MPTVTNVKKTGKVKKTHQSKKGTHVSAKGSKNGHKVGYEAKKGTDVPWTTKKIAFYEALKRIRSGNSAAVAKASKGTLHAGLVRHIGYHGTAAGLVRVERHEGQRGFLFVLTKKGVALDLAKVIKTGK